MDKTFNRVIKVILALSYAFLFIPLIVIIVMSFNITDYGMLPFVFTTEWYTYLFTESELFPATFLSLKFSFIVAIFSTILGTMSALGMSKMNVKIAPKFAALSSMPVVIPWLVQGISLLMIFNLMGIGRSYVGMFFGNLMVVIPYVFLLVNGRLVDSDRTPEDAAKMLGATPLKVFFDVTLPSITPGVFAGALMSFMVCFNSFVIQFYLAPFGVRTLPMEIFTLVRVGYKPDMNALATLLVIFSTSIVLILYRMGYSSKKLFNS